MSRLSYNEMSSVEEVRWQRNSAMTLKSKRGQQMLRDLEAALLALPQKRLLGDTFYEPESGEVCALAAYARHKGCDVEKLQRLELDSGEEQADWVAWMYDQARTLTWNIIDLNDNGGGYFVRHETPEQRYERVLQWVQSHLSPRYKALSGYLGREEKR